MLILSKFYRVSTEYIPEKTDVKRGFEEQQIIAETLEENYNLVQAVKMLNERDKRIICKGFVHSQNAGIPFTSGWLILSCFFAILVLD